MGYFPPTAPNDQHTHTLQSRDDPSAPTMEHTRLPTLSPANQRVWKRTLQAIAADLNLAPHLDPSTTAPADPNEFAKFKVDQERLCLLILASTPESITTRLSDDALTSPPYLLTSHILNQIKDSVSLPHELLEERARSITLDPGMELDAYLAKHDAMRIEMRNAHYPGIDSESTTIKFLLLGLRHNPDYRTAHDLLTLDPPTHISDVIIRLRRMEANIKTRTSAAHTNHSHNTYHTQYPIPRQPKRRIHNK